MRRAKDKDKDTDRANCMTAVSCGLTCLDIIRRDGSKWKAHNRNNGMWQVGTVGKVVCSVVRIGVFVVEQKVDVGVDLSVWYEVCCAA